MKKSRRWVYFDVSELMVGNRSKGIHLSKLHKRV
jgi:hypothetical protein